MPDAPAQTETVQDQGTSQVSEPVVSDAPWSKDLNSVFSDEGTRGQVDQFMREHVQPHVTKLEQDAARDEHARNLWNKLSDDPFATYVEITSQLFGDDASEQVFATLQSALSGEQGPEAQAAAEAAVGQQPAPATQQAPEPTADPRIQRMLETFEADQNEKLYNVEMERAVSANADLDGDKMRNNLHPFVVTANGDFDTAVGMYRSFLTQFGEPASGQEVADHTRQTAPPVGDGSGAPLAPETQQKGKTLDEAADNLRAMLRANRTAPPVGTV